jgi:hypothetical protein
MTANLLTIALLEMSSLPSKGDGKEGAWSRDWSASLIPK